MIDKMSIVLDRESHCEYCNVHLSVGTRITRIRYAQHDHPTTPQDHFIFDYHEGHWDPKPKEEI